MLLSYVTKVKDNLLFFCDFLVFALRIALYLKKCIMILCIAMTHGFLLKMMTCVILVKII